MYKIHVHDPYGKCHSSNWMSDKNTIKKNILEKECLGFWFTNDDGFVVKISEYILNRSIIYFEQKEGEE